MIEAVLQPREAVLRMAPYSPPSGGRADKLRLDFNENTIGASPRVVEALKRALSGDLLSMYPEYVEARPRLARHFGVDERELLLTNGTDEAIQVLVNTYVDDENDVLILKPSYAMYRFYSELAGGAIREIEYRRDDLSFPLEELLMAVRPDTRMILIANPNNPTGTGLPLDGVVRILERAPNAAVLIDEAYFEFCGLTALPWIQKYPNLFVSRTFSKVYGMAAMRIGCLFSAPENVAWMHKAQSPYSVNTLAVIAAAAAVEDQDYVASYTREVLAARDDIQAGLAILGIKAYPSMANFVLFEAGARAIEIRDKLREAGVLVRDRSYEIAGCIRVTCGTREHAARFLKELSQVW